MTFYYTVVRFGLCLVITIRWFLNIFYGSQTELLISERISNILPTVCCAVIFISYLLGVIGSRITNACRGRINWMKGDPSILRKVEPLNQALRNYVNTHRRNVWGAIYTRDQYSREKEVPRYCKSALKKYFQLIKATYWFQSHFYWPVNMTSCGWRREPSLLGIKVDSI